MTPEKNVKSFELGSKTYRYFPIGTQEEVGHLPFSIRILTENVLRNINGTTITRKHADSLLGWPNGVGEIGIPFMPSRVILQDFTGVPAVVDLAAMRSAIQKRGVTSPLLNPVIPVDLVIDHSVQVDYFGTADAYKKNVMREYERNSERYSILKWARQSFDGFRVVPPGTGIVHQVNLEYLSSVVSASKVDGKLVAHPDTLLGTDSHTTMINGISVLGWGVGGIEAEAVMLGQPYHMQLPDVVGLRLSGTLPAGATATDLVLTVTQMLREHGVVGKFIEFTGPGLDSLSLPDKATIANMSPEYGATVGFFPVDEETLQYLVRTGREDQVDLVRTYTKLQHLFRSETTREPVFKDLLSLDLGDVVPCVAGPNRPQDRIPLSAVPSSFVESLPDLSRKGEVSKHSVDESVIDIVIDDNVASVGHGSVVIAAITSCTNTSNPSVLIGAGLLAKKAVEMGLTVSPHVKTSLAPGSRVVTDYLREAGLLHYLELLRFHVVGYGCTTCIGNSGPLSEPVAKAVEENELVVAAVLSGNRNFEARIHPQVRANYLASPVLVVAYALAGRIDIDFRKESLGSGCDGEEVYLGDIWPTQDEIHTQINRYLSESMYRERYREVFQGDEFWKRMEVPGGDLYSWDSDSTYIQEPPFFIDNAADSFEVGDIEQARVLALLGDTVTTDHISPAGAISADSPAGKYLLEKGVSISDFNTYGSRRGNHHVMVRGTFANVRIRNLLLDGVEGGYTIYYPTGETGTIYEMSRAYMSDGTPLLVIAGSEYGTGSSRDWAAKGTRLLGVRAVIARSYERIHRSNLYGMGVLPLEFLDRESCESLGIAGDEVFSISGIKGDLFPRKILDVTARKDNGDPIRFQVLTRLESEYEVEVYRSGGILPMVLSRILKPEQ